MLFDATLLFCHQGNVYNFTAGEAISLAGVAGTLSTAINLGTPRDLGVGQGQETPQVCIAVTNAFTGPFTTASYTFNFMGSTNSPTANMVTYSSVTMNTFSLTTGSLIFFNVPPALPNVAGGTASALQSASLGLPQYYALAITSSNATVNITAGNIIAGIVLCGDSFVQVGAKYGSGFTVA